MGNTGHSAALLTGSGARCSAVLGASQMRTMRTALVIAISFLFCTMAAPAVAKPWRIIKEQWSAADEQGFGAFVAALGETNCSSSESCLRNPANPYRHTDQAFIDIDVDCAKLPYLLRAYYAWKNGLPFSYVDAVSGEGGDLRYTGRRTGRCRGTTSSTGGAASMRRGPSPRC